MKVSRVSLPEIILMQLRLVWYCWNLGICLALLIWKKTKTSCHLATIAVDIRFKLLSFPVILFLVNLFFSIISYLFVCSSYTLYVRMLFSLSSFCCYFVYLFHL